jgi:TPR repeat protein
MSVLRFFRILTFIILSFLLLPKDSHAWFFFFLPGSSTKQSDASEVAELQKKLDWVGLRDLAKKRLESDVNNAEWWVNLGYAQLRLSNFAEAEKATQEAIRLAPGNPTARNNLGAINQAQGKHKQALDEYLAALRIKPDYALALANAASMQFRLGRPDLAWDVIQQLKKIEPAQGKTLQDKFLLTDARPVGPEEAPSIRAQLQTNQTILIDEYSKKLIAPTERRVALVIGNNRYKKAQLSAAVNDARAIESAISKLGFKVTRLEDMSRNQMLKAIRGFADEINKPETVGLFYFAGHGVQSKGKNYLIPVDAEIEHEDDIEFQGVDIQYMLDKLSEIKNGMNIIVLDACRDNPYIKSRNSRSAGLAAIDGPPGAIIAFSTAPGQVARELEGENGLYTKHLLKNIQTEGIPVEEVFKRVRKGVIQETLNQQIPWENTSLLKDFYFQPAQPGKGFTLFERDSEQEAWEGIQASKNIYDLIAFLRKYPSTKFKRELLAKFNEVLAKLDPAPPMLKLEELPHLLNESYAGFGWKVLNQYSAEYYGLPDFNGMLITQVEVGSPAEKSGLLAGDILTKVNGYQIRSAADAINLGTSIRPGEMVQASVWRDKKELNLKPGIMQRASLSAILRQIAYSNLAAGNIQRAIQLYEYSAANGDPYALSNLGQMQVLHFVYPDYKLAESYLRQAVSLGEPNAFAYLSALYLSNAGGFAKHQDAFKLAKVSAEQGVPLGAALIAYCYFNGIGVEQNYQEALRWAKFGSANGDPTAMHLLGNAYKNGYGVPRDLNMFNEFTRRMQEPRVKSLSRGLILDFQK